MINVRITYVVLLSGLSHSLEGLLVMNVANPVAAVRNGAENVKESKCVLLNTSAEISLM